MRGMLGCIIISERRGTVFSALILLSLFTFLFNKVFASRMTGDTAVPAEPPPCPPPDDAAEQEEEKRLGAGRRKAAAIAVSVALVELAKRQAVFNPISTREISWRQDARRRQLDSWSISKDVIVALTVMRGSSIYSFR